MNTIQCDPRRIDNHDNPRVEEEGCIAITQEKKYYELQGRKGDVFIKRSLTPSEYLINIFGKLVLPYRQFERLRNEAATIRYVQDHTNIPTPNIRCSFEDHGRYYIITDMVPGAPMSDLSESQKEVVEKELETYVDELKQIKSTRLGGVNGDVCLPYRLQNFVDADEKSTFREASDSQFVLCHNDLSQQNIIVDPETLKINAILDWEYAGFYPSEFERPFYKRLGPSVAINNEKDDVSQLLEVLDTWKTN